jgi:glutathione S-transferase
VIRLTLAAAGVDFEDVTPAREDLKNNLDAYLCGQCPRYSDADVDMVQSMAIVRHLGRKHGLYGSTLKDNACVDVVLEAVAALVMKYSNIFVGNKSDEEKEAFKAEFWKIHGDPTSATTFGIGGAHFSFLDNMLKKFGGDGPFVLGEKLSIADIALFSLLESAFNYMGFEENISSTYPSLKKQYEAVAAVPNVANYLTSDKRFPK